MVRALVIMILSVGSWAMAAAQQPPSSATEETAESVVSVSEVLLRFSQFAAELQGITDATNVQVDVDPRMPVSPELIHSYEQHIQSIEQSLRSVLTRWDTYQIAQQYEIAASDTLMSVMASLDELRQACADSIDKRKQVCQALRDFSEGEQYLACQDTVYKKLYKKAFPLSLVAKSAPLLAKLQAREALLFADVQARYDKVKGAVALVPALAPRMPAVDDDYIELKTVSEKIQALAYKPLLVRLKDYLIGFAAVAMLLLFFNMMVQKYQAAKKVRKSMKQYNDMLKNSGMNTEYPTI